MFYTLAHLEKLKAGKNIFVAGINFELCFIAYIYFGTKVTGAVLLLSGTITYVLFKAIKKYDIYRKSRTESIISKISRELNAVKRKEEKYKSAYEKLNDDLALIRESEDVFRKSSDMYKSIFNMCKSLVLIIDNSGIIKNSNARLKIFLDIRKVIF